MAEKKKRERRLLWRLGNLGRRRRLRRSHGNLEDVNVTIAQIGEEKKKRRSRALTVIMWVFFPFTATALLVSYIFTKQRVRLTTKTTVIFTVIFGVLITGYIVFALISFRNYLDGEGVESHEFIQSMLILSTALGLAFLLVGAAAGAIISNAMLRPIRKMAAELEAIDGENLSGRLRPPDSQDEIMELAENINSMLDAIEESFSRQSNFVADASHELKTPLSVIRGYADLLGRWGKADENVLSEGIDAIRRESLYMTKIIDQMLLLARLGRLAMHLVPQDLTAIIGEIVEGYSVIGCGHKLTFLSGDSVICVCDKTMITEAVRTLIDNAIKYTAQDGDITVSVFEAEGVARISVRDTGIGIGEDDLPYVFDRFYRCDKTRGREKGSAGLGLTICKSIVEMMEGSITATSRRGEGTEFVITL